MVKFVSQRLPCPQDLNVHWFMFLFPGLIDYNFHCFRKAIQDVFEVQHKMAALSKMPPDLNDTGTIQSNGLVGQGHSSDVLS